MHPNSFDDALRSAPQSPEDVPYWLQILLLIGAGVIIYIVVTDDTKASTVADSKSDRENNSGLQK